MPIETILYIFGAVLVVSLASIIGILSLSFNSKKLEKVLIYFVSFSAGALFGDAFIHLLPEALENTSSFNVGVYILCGIMFSLAVEKFIHWRHCHLPASHKHAHPVAYLNLIGDAFHNFIDGLIISASFIVSIPLGIATTLAILFHEIPQEIGDFGILLYGGFSKKKAILFNFLTALTAMLGAAVGIMLSNVHSVVSFLLPFAAGNFIYIAGSDIIPEIHRQTCEEKTGFKTIAKYLAILAGIGVMLALLLLE